VDDRLGDRMGRRRIYAAKILGGEKPGDLPIEQASKFILVVNAGPQSNSASACRRHC